MRHLSAPRGGSLIRPITSSSPLWLSPGSANRGWKSRFLVSALSAAVIVVLDGARTFWGRAGNRGPVGTICSDMCVTWTGRLVAAVPTTLALEPPPTRSVSRFGAPLRPELCGVRAAGARVRGVTRGVSFWALARRRPGPPLPLAATAPLQRGEVGGAGGDTRPRNPRGHACASLAHLPRPALHPHPPSPQRPC